MYEHCIPPDTVFEPVPWEEEEQPTPAQPKPPAPPRPAQARGGGPPQFPSGELVGGAAKEVNALLKGIFSQFSLNDLDSGDILLILIVLFLFMEGDNLDLVIALGLMLLLSLGEQEKKEETPAASSNAGLSAQDEQKNF